MVQQVEKKQYGPYATAEISARYVRTHWAKRANDTETEYAVYRQDELVIIGTASECAAELGIKVSSFFMKMTPSHRARNGSGRLQLDIVRLDDEEDDEW